MELLKAAFILASLSPLAHAGVIGPREAPTNNSSLPSCPAVDGDTPVFHPHPTNCSLFYQCWQGHSYLYSCPAGLYWDQHLTTCNWPSQVECHLNDTTDEPSTEDPSIENTTADDGTEKRALENLFFPSCPSSPDPVYFPHPSNCSLFYECSNGIPYLISCPAGLYFDPIHSVCNYANQVTCNATDETTKNPTEEPFTTTENPSLNKTHHSKVIQFDESLPTCPDIDSNMSVYFPHPQNCSLFYECSNRIPYLFSCPGGLYFDPTLNVCNSPNQVTCNVTNETTQKPTEETSKHTEEPSKPTEEPSNPTEEPSNPTEEPSKPTEEPSKPTEQPSKPTEQPSKPTEEPPKPTEVPSLNKTFHIQFDKPSPTCPDIDGNMSVYFPHPQNCSLFYECSNGVPYLFSCPDGLYFDATLNVCNSPSQVTCNASDETTQKPIEEPSKPTEEPLKPTEEPSKPTEIPSVNKTFHNNVIQFDTPSPTCPAIDGNMSVYFPHPQNCSLFYECSNGIPYLFSCPDGLYFDPTVNICNTPSQVTCNATNETTQKPTEESSKPTEKTPKPTEEPSKPTEEPSKPTEEPSKPTEEPSKPTEEPSKPTQEPSKPTEEPSTPTKELSKTTEKSIEEPNESTEKEGSGLLSRA